MTRGSDTEASSGRRAPLRAAVSVAGLVLAFVASCAGDQIAGPPPVPVDVTLDAARARIFDAEQRLAAAYELDGAAGLVERIASLQQVDAASRPSTDADGLEAWTRQRRVERIAQLERRLQEYMLRGSTDAYRAAATIEVELDELRRMAVDAGLSRDVVPEDALRLLDRDELVKLDIAWAQASHHFEVTQARIVLPSESGLAAAEVIRKQRTRIDAALAAPPTQLATKFARAPKRPVIEDAAWASYAAQNRNQLIDARERELIQQALAQDGGDIPAIRLLAARDAASPEIASAELRAAALDRSLALYPSDVVPKMLYDRLYDPVRGAWRDAVLRGIFETERWSMPQELQDSRPRWELALLDDADVAECFAWASQTLQAIERHDARGPGPAVREVNRLQLATDLKELRAEILRRQSGVQPPTWRMPESTSRPSLIDSVPTDVAGLSYDLQRSFWQSLDILAAGGYLTPVTRALDLDLRLVGLTHEANQLAEDYRSCESLKGAELARPGPLRLDTDTKFDGATPELTAMASHILAGLNDLSARGAPAEKVNSVRLAIPSILVDHARKLSSDAVPARPPRPFDDPTLHFIHEHIGSRLELYRRPIRRPARVDSGRIERAMTELRQKNLRENAQEHAFEREMEREREGLTRDRAGERFHMEE